MKGILLGFDFRTSAGCPNWPIVLIINVFIASIFISVFALSVFTLKDIRFRNIIILFFSSRSFEFIHFFLRSHTLAIFGWVNSHFFLILETPPIYTEEIMMEGIEVFLMPPYRSSLRWWRYRAFPHIFIWVLWFLALPMKHFVIVFLETTPIWYILTHLPLFIWSSQNIGYFMLYFYLFIIFFLLFFDRELIGLRYALR